MYQIINKIIKSEKWPNARLNYNTDIREKKKKRGRRECLKIKIITMYAKYFETLKGICTWSYFYINNTRSGPYHSLVISGVWGTSTNLLLLSVWLALSLWLVSSLGITGTNRPSSLLIKVGLSLLRYSQLKLPSDRFC